MVVTRWATLALALSVIAVASGLRRPPASGFPVGSYDSDAYTLTFDTSGTFHYRLGDRLMVQGTYVVHDSTIALTDETGSDACVGRDRNPGTYHWRVVRQAVWFRTVHDACPDRIRGLADQAWKPHRAR
jgi:hypothetical protein